MESRRIIAQVLAAWEPDVDASVIESCTSELVTDALRHGDPPLHLVVQHWTDCVRVIVINGRAPSGHETGLATYDESSVRRRIVEGLATSHGVDALPVGTANWFDAATSP